MDQSPVRRALHNSLPVLTPRAKTIREQVLRVRPSAIDREGVLRFDQVPLFVLLAPLLSGDELIACLELAVGNGSGALEGLDRHDRRQTARLETAILNACGSQITIDELMSFEMKHGFRFFEVSLVLVRTPCGDLLGFHDVEELPSFQAFALGTSERLLALVDEAATCNALGVGSEGDEVLSVVKCRPLPSQPS